MRVPDSKLAEVSAAADIVQVISGYVDLKRAGKDFRGLCPFHGDKDPSFYVSPQKGIFYCFGCAVGGSVFNFVMKMENVSFAESVRILADRYGVPFSLERGFGETGDDRANLLSALDVARHYFVDQLDRSAPARDYLRERGIPEDWKGLLGLGFAPESWEGLSDHLRRSGVAHGDAVAAGLIRARSGGGHYDYFRSRIMIPIRDLNGRVCAFGGRVFGEGDPKYLNSPESHVFSKKRVLFGLDSAREAIRRDGFIILVEGYFDQISLRIAGVENVVAPLGTALGTEQVRLVKRFSSEVVTVFDGDEAGLRAVKRAIPLFLSEGIEPRCVILKDDKDPDEAVRRIGVEGFRQMLDSSVPIIDFLLESLKSLYDVTTLGGRRAALEECLPVLREFADSPESDYLIEKFSSRLRVREEHLRRALKKSLGSRRLVNEEKTSTRRNLFDLDVAERNVVRGMLLRDGFIEEVVATDLVKDLCDRDLRSLAEKMLTFRERVGVFDATVFCASLEDENFAAIVAGWMQPRREEDDISRNVSPDVDEDLILKHSAESIRLRKVRRRMSEIQEQMKKCEPGSEKFDELAREFGEHSRRLHA